MPKHAPVVLLFVLCAFPDSPRALDAAEARATIAVKGSDTIGGKLGPALASAYRKTSPNVTVEWEGLGSATAFPGLFGGSADIGAASRPVNEKELDEARALGIELKEYVLGYDGVAVIVNPANKVTELTVEELSRLFSGSIANWRELGGENLPVKLLGRPSYSGTHAFFKEKVLRKGSSHGTEEYGAGTVFVEHSEDLLQEVAKNRAAVGYVGLAYVRPSVVALRVSAGKGAPFIAPGAETVRTGRYPIYRPLLLYTRGEPQGELRRFLTFVLVGEGRKVILSHDYIPADVPPTIQRTAVTTSREAEPALTLHVYRVGFNLGRLDFAPGAQAILLKVASEAKNRGAKVRLIGNADSIGTARDNEWIALARAQAVARRLAELGLSRKSIQVLARGADAPVATNNTPAGRRENRRVDIEVLPPEPLSAATTR